MDIRTCKGFFDIHWILFRVGLFLVLLHFRHLLEHHFVVSDHFVLLLLEYVGAEILKEAHDHALLLALLVFGGLRS